MRFAAWLRTTRESRVPRITQGALAARAAELDAAAPESERATFDQNRISAWELGKGRPGLRQLELLFIALETTDEERTAGRALWEAEQLQGLPGHDAADGEAA